MQRRSFLRRLAAFTGVALLLRPVLALAARSAGAFDATTQAGAERLLFGEREFEQGGGVRIDARDRVENGAVVPLAVASSLQPTETVTLLVEKNPNPLIAHFELGPECRGPVAIRIKIAEPSVVMAVVGSKGRLYRARRFIEVTEGGCR